MAVEMGKQFAPPESQRSHSYAKLVGSLLHDPLCAVSTWPCWAVPVIVGGAVLLGSGGALTAAVAVELAGPLEPPAFFAVSCTSSACPTSDAPGTYVCAVAPAIGRQPLPRPSHCSHW